MLAHLGALTGQATTLWVRDKEVVASINAEHRNRRYLSDVRIDDGVRATDDLEQAVRDAALVVFAIPSGVFRAVAGQAGAFVQGDQVLVSATKGLEPGTFSRMSQVLGEETCAKKVGAISGPNLAKEILQGQPSATVVASRYKEVVALTARLLHGPTFRIYGNHDVKGVELAGALKNVIAIASGVAAGLGFHHNVRALLVTRGLSEVARLGVKLGADPLTFSGLAGIGDMLVTCGSELSRNFRVGLGLAQGQTLEAVLGGLKEVAEGVNTTRVAVALARSVGVPMPITEGVHALLFERRTPADIMHALMTTPARYEIDFDYTAEVH
jgi:glycerol-3-phosphate dehydrogenase (NAD(P)+)